MAGKYEIDMVHGSLMPKIIRFSIPLIITNMLQMFYNAADLIVVGRFAGSNSLAAVGSTGALTAFFVNFFMGLALGANVIISQQIGASRIKAAKKSVHTAVTISIIVGVFVAITGFFLAKPLLILTGCTSDVIDEATIYMKIIFLGMPAQMVYNYAAAILRAVGDTKHPLYFLSLAGVLNIVLNIVLVAGFGRKADGVAIATVFAQTVSAVLIIRLLMRYKGVCRLRIKRLGINKESLIGMMKLGLPSGIQSSLFSLSNIVIQSTVNSFGTAVMAGSAAAGNIEGFVYTAMNAVANAAVAFSGQNAGAKRPERISRVLKDCIIVDLILASVLGAVCIGFSKNLVSIYIPSGDAAVLAGVQKLSIIGGTYLLCGIMETLSYTIRGMGKSVLPMLISLVGVCGFRILWVFAVLPLNRTFIMLMIGYPVSWSIVIVFNFIYYKKVKSDFTKRILEEKLTDA